jgi:hypothetical protein
MVSEVWQVPPHDSRAETPALPRLGLDLDLGQEERMRAFEESSAGRGEADAIEFRDAGMRELLKRLSQI